MTDPKEHDAVSRSIKKLTVGFCIMTVISFLNLGVSIILLVCTLGGGNVPRVWTNSSETVRKLKSRPLEEQLEAASVVALSTWRKDGGDYRAVITEILKHREGTNFAYKVGDEVRRSRRNDRAGVDYGEGEVMFFMGSPAKLEYSIAYSEGRLRNDEGSEISALREILRSRQR